MKFKKVIAAVLGACMIMGIAGCTKNGDANGDKNGDTKNNKDAEQISEVIGQYYQALTRFDGEGVLKLTNWEEDDTEYKETKELMDAESLKSKAGEDVIKVYKAVALTIRLEYENEDLKIDGDKATLKVTYSLVGWGTIFADPSDDYDQVVSRIESEKQTIPVEGKITFEKDDGEWKISKIPELKDVYSFVLTTPQLFESQPTGSEPSDTEPSGSANGTAFPDSYKKALKAYEDVLKANKDKILAVAKNYGLSFPAGFYDYDGNEIMDLFFIAESENGRSANLYVYSYNEYAGEAINVLTVSDFVSQGQASSDYMIYVTDREVVITRTFGESTVYNVVSYIYNFKWELQGEYKRTITEDYDPKTDKSKISTKYYINGTEIPAVEYIADIKNRVNKTVIVIDLKFNLSKEDPEYDLQYKPACTMMTYDAALGFIMSMTA